MSPEISEFYEFANFRLDLAQKLLLCDGKPVPLTPKVYDTLELLLENRSRLIEKDELMQKLWPDRFVEESNLTSNIKMLRKALGDDAANPRFIETVPRRGYRFIGEVRRPNGALPSPAAERAPEPEPLQPTRKRYVLVSVAVVLIISVFGIAFVWVGGNRLFKSKQPKYTRLTTSGKVTNAAIVPDGKSIVYSQRDGAGESLWLRQIDSGNQTEILPPEDVEFVGLSVSPDGNFAYYSVFSKNSAVLTLSRVALGGGASESIPNVDTDVSVSFSPDGKRFAFVDSRSSVKETDLKIADADGTNQQVLIKTAGEGRILPFFRASPVAWSPDGETLACAIKETDENGSSYRILLVDPETGREKYLSNQSWSGIENLVWRDDDNLAFIEIEQNSPVRRIWQISRSSGEVHQLTNDLNGYEWLGSAGGRLITLQKTAFSSLHVAGLEENSNTPPPKQIFGESGVIESVGWSRGDKILYNSLASGKNEIWQINADGTSPRQITSDSHLILNFAVSPTDDSLVFSSLHNGKISLAAAAADGQNARPLTDGPTDFLPAFSPNGETVVFQRGMSPSTLWSVASSGDQLPQQVTGYQATHAAISPDGKQIAFHFMDYGTKDPHWKLGLIDSQTHEFVDKREFPMPVTQRDTAWNPRNNLLTMTFGNGENSSILLWSLADGKIQTLDNVDAGRIGAFAWSPDGSKLVFSQVFETSDVVSLDNF
jgi:DNA-binding winged helix-turn-helix (wHTH) protein/Tol biopolymer transport system component